MVLGVSWGIITCGNQGKVDKSEADANLVLGFVAGQSSGKNAQRNLDFVLNGSWNSFTGNSTTDNTILIIKAKKGSPGVILTDSADFGGYSSCQIIVDFDNQAGYFIGQNPENNGACFGFPDPNKGRFFKIVFFTNPSKENSYWLCSTANGYNTKEEAINATFNPDRTNPGQTGCGTFPWSRIEKR